VKRSPTGDREFGLLCLIAQPEPDLARIRERLDEGIDAARLVQLAELHGLRPRLARCWSALSWAGAGTGERSGLELFQRHHAMRALAMSRELLEVASSFAESGIAFATFKGPALAVALYGDLAGREYNDIDIIVPQLQFAQAEAQLEAMGYRNSQGSREFCRAFLGGQGQYAFTRPDGTGAAVDLHWAFSGTHVTFPLRPAEAWGDGDIQRLSIGEGRQVPAIGGANLALLLAGHGTKEAWRFLKWVCDLGLMIERHRELDWPGIHRRAVARGCGDAVLLGCSMAKALLELAVPDGLAGPLQASARVRSLTGLLIGRMLETPRRAFADNFADLILCDSRLDRIRGAVDLAVTPSAGDYLAMPLPAPLWPIYYGTRPFRLAAKALMGALTRR